MGSEEWDHIFGMEVGSDIWSEEWGQIFDTKSGFRYLGLILGSDIWGKEWVIHLGEEWV